MAIHSGLLTAEEFAALPRDGMRLELVRGELVAMAPAFADHGEVVGALHAELWILHSPSPAWHDLWR
ncbi:MAG TPA: Uma2 family endonuclease [Ktedonobacterales bacterium]